MKSTHRYAFLALLPFFVTLISGCYGLRITEARADGRFSETFTVDVPLELDVYSGAGSIVVTGAESDEVEIVGRVRAWSRSVESAEDRVRDIEDDPPIDRAADGRVVVGRRDDDGRFDRIAISYDIRVPAGTAVRARTGSGGIEIAGLAGELDVDTGSGRLSIRDVQGDVRARTGSGGIDAESIAGSFEGRTGSGGITLSQTADGAVDVTTGSGGIRLSGVPGPLNARAGSGGIRVEGDPSDTWSLSTGSGGVTLTVPSDAGFDLDANTSSGRVEVRPPLEFDGESDDRRRRLRGAVGGGGPSVEVRSASGGIRIRT